MAAAAKKKSVHAPDFKMLYPTKVRMLIPTDDEDDDPAGALLPPMSTAECAPKEGWRREHSEAPFAVHQPHAPVPKLRARPVAPQHVPHHRALARRRRGLTGTPCPCCWTLCRGPNCALSRADPSVPGAMGDDGEVCDGCGVDRSKCARSSVGLDGRRGRPLG